MADAGRSIEPYQIARAIGQAKPRVRANIDGSYTIRGIDGQTFFGPAQPTQPLAQDPRSGAIGRQFDYLTGTNLNYTPRSSESIGFSQLRALAENLNVLRLGIETRKDQMEALDWTIQTKDKKKKADVSAVKAFFEYPDRIHSYAEWMRGLLEEKFVTDAVTIYPRLTNAGELYSLDWMDGALIKVLLDAGGRTPMPPSPAYQQVLKGVAAVDYTFDEIIYRPGNSRVWKAYGFSVVEQIIFTVNLALRRELWKLSYYTEGSIPDAIGMLPESWTPAQMIEFQANWDILFENQSGESTATKRKMRWIPSAKDIKFAKDEILKDDFDEWLARVVCYALSLEPTPFVKANNRATAENQKQQSRSEGLIPLKRWWKSLMDYIIAKYLKRADLEFGWQDEEATDPLEKAQVDASDVNSGIKTLNEIRNDRGLEPLDQPEANLPRQPTTVTIIGAASRTLHAG